MQTQAVSSSFTHDDELQNWAQGSQPSGEQTERKKKKRICPWFNKTLTQDMHIRKIAAAHFSEMDKNRKTKQQKRLKKTQQEENVSFY